MDSFGHVSARRKSSAEIPHPCLRFMNSKNYIEPLDALLAANNIPPDLIDAVIDSGFYMRGWVEPFSGRTWQSVSDAMYGNKQFSSSFNIDDFIKYVRGDYAFPA